MYAGRGDPPPIELRLLVPQSALDSLQCIIQGLRRRLHELQTHITAAITVLDLVETQFDHITRRNVEIAYV